MDPIVLGDFIVKPVKVWAGDHVFQGWALKLYNPTQRLFVVGGMYAFPGIVDAALSSDPVFDTPEKALAAWGAGVYFPTQLAELAKEGEYHEAAYVSHATNRKKRKAADPAR
jgi:hypothetical protein